MSMTYEEALDIVEQNHVCPKHSEPKRNIGYATPNWVCEICGDEDFEKRSREYKEKQDRIREAAKMVYGIPKGSKKRSFWDRLFGSFNSDGGSVNG